MATQKFQLPSPYSGTPPPPPKEDEAYYRHLDDMLLKEGEDGKVIYGVALFGLGKAGSIHLVNLLENRRVKILYIIDEDVARLNKASKYNDLKDTKMLTPKDSHLVHKDSKVNFVIICTPVFTHEAIIEAALANRQAVICEKPLADNLESAQRIFNLAKQAKLPLICAYNRRFDPSYINLKTRVRSGEIGKVLTIKRCSRDSPAPALGYLKFSGGFFRDSATHDIEQILSIMGELPNKVCSLGTVNIPEIREMNEMDNIVISMSFPSGAVGIIDLNRQCSYGHDQRVEVFGEKGMLKVENCLPNNVEKFSHESVNKAPIYYSFPSRYEESYKRELKHFVAVLDGKETPASGNVVLAVIKVAIAAEESARLGRVVEMKWTAEDLIE